MQEVERRKMAIHLTRQGSSPREIACELERSVAWVYKWQKRFFAEQDWRALEDQPHRPQHGPRKLPDPVRAAIRQARSELEAEAAEPEQLSYIGARAVQARLRKQHIQPLPSISSIERELRAANMVRPRQPDEEPEVNYPHLHPNRPLQLIQADIVPHYLAHGPAVACFNAVDVISHYPTGQQLLTKRAADAMQFLMHVWQTIGLAEYTQVDNESCFSGGFTHPGALGQVIRLALLVGTQLIFSPVHHPASNGTIERFHQEYNKHTWNKIDFADLPAVAKQSTAFFAAYCTSEHHTALRGRAPADLHPVGGRLPDRFVLPDRLPLTVGQVHFLRRVNDQRQIRLLNIDWEIPAAQPNQGVWATLELAAQGATVHIFDAAPDGDTRVRLAEHPFPLKEAVQPLDSAFQRPIPVQLPGWFPDSSDRVLSRLFGISTML